MQRLTSQGRSAVSDIASRYNLSSEAVEHMLVAVNNGSGSMAQFNCPELGGSGQWMRGGMTMVGDMFNNGLKSTVDNLCNELSQLLANTQVFPEISTGQSGSNQWWPDNLGTPISSGSQNSTRYALFNTRLAVEMQGGVTVYDTLDHQIGGVSQQQGGNDSLTFSSQYGTIQVSTLPVISGPGFNANADTNFVSSAAANPVNAQNTNQGNQFAEAAPSQSTDFAAKPTLIESGAEPVADSDSSGDIIALIEKLSQLHGAGVLSDEEFGTKKQELLARL